jgi:hypothetical protein
MLLGGCGGDEVEPTTTGAPSPTTTILTGGQTPLEAVTAWLDALSIGRYQAADVMVVEEQFVLLLAVESFSPELYQNLVAGGVSPDVSRTFWESFVAGVRGFSGADITEVEAIGATTFAAYGREFAEIEARSPRGDLTIIARQGVDDRWHVDLLGTFGGSFAPLFNPWVERLPGEISEPLEALARQRPSLEVARDRALGADGNELDRLLDQLPG